MREERKGILLLIIILLLAGSACSVPGFSAATPTPTPEANGFLNFSVPAPGYTITLNPGDRVPGARLEYLGQEGDIYKVRINGQAADKRLGDSFVWSGIIAPGVFAEYNLRLTATLPGFGTLPVTGGVKLTILDWQPVEVVTLPDMSEALRIGNIIIDANVPVGENISASTLVYEGLTTQGTTTFAQLSGLSGHPYFAQGDSLVWTGQLSDGVYIRYNLRVLTLDENNLRLGGVADLWLTSPTYP